MTSRRTDRLYSRGTTLAVAAGILALASVPLAGCRRGSCTPAPTVLRPSSAPISTSYLDSPFGFLSVYVDTSNTAPIYASYGGFSTIQALHADLGVHWDRGSGKNGGAIWGAIARNADGGRDNFDSYVATAAANGINLLVTIEPGYCTATDGQYLPADTAAFGQFVAALVVAYPAVKHWQIHNEVNGNVFWKDTPANYAALVRTASNAIRESCADCKIVLGSSINLDANANPVSVGTYFGPVLSDLANDGSGKKYFDIFDYHFFVPKGTDLATYYRQLASGVDSVRTLLADNGMTGIDIWTTESMLFTTDGMSAAEVAKLPLAFQTVTEADQATGLLKTQVLALSKGVKKIFWTKLTEGPWFDFMFDRAGLVRHPDESGSTDKKLSYFTEKLLIAALDGSDWNDVQTIYDSGGAYVYRFVRNGTPTWVAWRDVTSAPTSITVPVGSGVSAVKVTRAVPAWSSGKDVPDFQTAFSATDAPVASGVVTLALADLVPVLVTVSSTVTSTLGMH